MSDTFCPHNSSLTEVLVAKETVVGVYTEVGAEVYAHNGVPGFTRGHTPIDGSSHFGTRQVVEQDGGIGGFLDPSIPLLLPFRYENMQRILEAVLGGVNPTGGVPAAEWAIESALSSWSVGFIAGRF